MLLRVIIVTFFISLPNILSAGNGNCTCNSNTTVQAIQTNHQMNYQIDPEHQRRMERYYQNHRAFAQRNRQIQDEILEQRFAEAERLHYVAIQRQREMIQGDFLRQNREHRAAISRNQIYPHS